MTAPEPVALWQAADWPAPAHIKAGTSLREGGLSSGNFTGLNLATHVGDDKNTVEKNRQLFTKQQQLPAEPAWLKQTHSNHLTSLDKEVIDADADGSYTSVKARVCCVLTADCVPLLFCDKTGSTIAAVHAGWRGISKGIIDNAASLYSKSEDVLVWIGPCISAPHYEVGRDVFEACTNYLPDAEKAFKRHDEPHWYCDLVTLVKCFLTNNRIKHVYESGLCTYANEQLFYSYRRDGTTGRTAAMIWME